MRRVAADGADGDLRDADHVGGFRRPTDLLVSPDGGSVYWLDNNGNRREVASRADGSGMRSATC